MKIEIPDDVAATIGFSETEMLEFLAISLYKKQKINGVTGGEILGISEMEFHGLLAKCDEYVSRDVEAYWTDIENLKDL